MNIRHENLRQKTQSFIPIICDHSLKAANSLLNNTSKESTS